MAKRRPVDLATVRTARSNLTKLAKEHPELLGPGGPDNRAGWREALDEDAMANTTQYTFRLPDDLIARLDAYAAKQSSATGFDLSRADVVKQLLTRALDSADGSPRAAPKRKAAKR